VITTRTPVADLADHEGTSAPRRESDQLSGDAGSKLLRALGVKGDEVELRSASDEFSCHCLALTLLGSYLTDAYHGDIRHRKEVSERLAHDVRQGVHGRKVMESYQIWFGEGPELSILRILAKLERGALTGVERTTHFELQREAESTLNEYAWMRSGNPRDISLNVPLEFFTRTVTTAGFPIGVETFGVSNLLTWSACLRAGRLV
jgi:hypothetical protein